MKGVNKMAAKPIPLFLLVVGLLGTFVVSGRADEATVTPKINDINGHVLLRKEWKDDKYAVGQLATHMVIAEVQNGKVVNMTAGSLPVKRIKIITSAALRDGYCFANDFQYTCFWYAPADVYEDSSWYEFDPNYDLSDPQ
jgi:hypothetical protein